MEMEGEVERIEREMGDRWGEGERGEREGDERESESGDGVRVIQWREVKLGKRERWREMKLTYMYLSHSLTSILYSHTRYSLSVRQNTPAHKIQCITSCIMLSYTCTCTCIYIQYASKKFP